MGPCPPLSSGPAPLVPRCSLCRLSCGRARLLRRPGGRGCRPGHIICWVQAARLFAHASAVCNSTVDSFSWARAVPPAGAQLPVRAHAHHHRRRLRGRGRDVPGREPAFFFFCFFLFCLLYTSPRGHLAPCGWVACLLACAYSLSAWTLLAQAHRANEGERGVGRPGRSRAWRTPCPVQSSAAQCTPAEPSRAQLTTASTEQLTGRRCRPGRVVAAAPVSQPSSERMQSSSQARPLPEKVLTSLCRAPALHSPHQPQVTTLLSKVDEVQKLPRLSAEALAELRGAVEAQGGVVKEAKAAAAADKVGGRAGGRGCAGMCLHAAHVHGRAWPGVHSMCMRVC